MQRCIVTWICLSAMVMLSACGEPPKPTVTLHEAARMGNIAQLKSHFHWGCDVNLRDEYGRTPLHVAAEAGQAGAVRQLIAKDADVNAARSTMKTYLVVLKCGMHIDAHRWTPLHLAALDGHVDVAKLLIDNGADVNAYVRQGGTPLGIATYQMHTEFVELLKKKGAAAEEREGIEPMTYQDRMEENEAILRRENAQSYLDLLARQLSTAIESGKTREELVEIIGESLESIRKADDLSDELKEKLHEVIMAAKNSEHGIHGAIARGDFIIAW